MDGTDAANPTIEPFQLRAAGDAEMFANVYPWDFGRDAEIRNTRVVDPSRYGDSLQHKNTELLLEMGTRMGKEGSDFQNPYVWQSRGVLTYPIGTSTGLVPDYGVGGAAKAEDVLLNVLSGGGILNV